MSLINEKARFLKNAHPLIFKVKWDGRIIFLEGGFKSLLAENGWHLKTYKTIQAVFKSLQVPRHTFEKFRDSISVGTVCPGFTAETSLEIPIQTARGTRWFMMIGVFNRKENTVQGQIIDIHEAFKTREKYTKLRRLTYGTDRLGTRIALGKENARERDLTIMFVDAVDSTSKLFAMNLNQSRCYIENLCQIITETVEEYGGYVDKFMGDGAMIVWGLPIEEDVSLGRHPLDAVLAGRAMLMKAGQFNQDKEELHQVHLRIGIDSGKVLSGVFKNKQRKIFTSIGNPVNIAARLEKHADPDSLLISHTHLDRLQAAFSDDLSVLHCSLFRLKGVPDVVKACKIV